MFGLQARGLFMADQYRASADLILKWALSEAGYCSIEVADWFPDLGKPKFFSKLAGCRKWRFG